MHYFDYAATTPCLVAEAMAPYWADQFANTGSLHTPGYQAKETANQVRRQLATLFHSDQGQWVMTSGATESNLLALGGFMTANHLQPKQNLPKHLVISAIEHDAVAQPARQLCQRHGWQLTELPVEAVTGLITPKSLDALLAQHPASLVSIMHGNNEVGTLQPIGDLATVAKAHGASFHTDAAQTAGKMPLELDKNWANVDYMTLSGHKCYGPKGIGALYLAENAPRIEPNQLGGGQQNGLRGGTEPLPLMVGLAAAVTDSLAWHTTHSLSPFVSQLRDTILAACPNALWNGPWHPDDRVPGLAHFSFPGLNGDALVNQLGMRGFAVSSGSACHSQQLTPSSVVLALGRDNAAGLGTLRISMGRLTTQASVDALSEALIAVSQKLYTSRKKETAS